MAKALSVRDLIAGPAGTVSIATFGSRPAKITFSTDMADYIRIGSTVRLTTNSLHFTVERLVSGTVYYARQAYGSAVNNSAYHISDYTTSRNRGTSGTVAQLVADAAYYQYCAYQDQSGTPDWYHYICTLAPVAGVHPFTKDKWTGRSWATSPHQDPIDVGILIPNLGERVSALDAEPAVIY